MVRTILLFATHVCSGEMLISKRILKNEILPGKLETIRSYKLFFSNFVYEIQILKLKTMKSIIYIFLFSICFSLHLSAQKYATLLTEDWTNGSWVNSMMFNNTFDANGNITMSSIDMWNDTTSVWDQGAKTSNTLNSDATINFSLTQSWSKSDNMWQDVQKMSYTYDASKNVLTQNSQMPFGMDWMDFTMSTHTYDANGRVVKIVNQSMNFATMQMKNSTQITFTYNSDGTLNQTVNQNWNATSSAWENSQRSTNTYNSSKLVVSDLTETYESNAWVNSTKTTLTYNSDGSLNESLDQNWDTSGATWVDSSKETFTYNSDGSINQMLAMDWMADQSSWENQSRMTYTYNSVTIVQPELAGTGQLRVFPNPFTDVVSIEDKSLNESNIQLFNVNGQLIRTFQKGEPLSKISLASLKNGVYILKAVSPESQQVVKILKEQ